MVEMFGSMEKKVDVTTDNNFGGHYVPFLIYFRYLIDPKQRDSIGYVSRAKRKTLFINHF